MVQPFWKHEASRKSDYSVAVLASILSPGTAPNMSVYGLDHHFQGHRLDVVSCYFTFLHPVVGVSSSVWWFNNGNWCFLVVPCCVGPS